MTAVISATPATKTRDRKENDGRDYNDRQFGCSRDEGMIFVFLRGFRSNNSASSTRWRNKSLWDSEILYVCVRHAERRIFLIQIRMIPSYESGEYFAVMKWKDQKDENEISLGSQFPLGN